MKMRIENVLIVDPVKGEFTGDVLLESGKIKSISPRELKKYDAILMPGFVDPHTHGCAGIDTMKMSKEELGKWENFLYSQGVTAFLPTTVSANEKDMIHVSTLVGEYIKERTSTSVYGIHYEGPYINVGKKGAQNQKTIRNATAKEMENVLYPHVRLITMAPEVGGFYDVLPRLKENGTVISLGHTDANFLDMKRAFLNGVDRITHFPNAIKSLHHRELGGVGAGFYLDFNVEMIVDGVHLAPEFVDMVYRTKGAGKIMLITDSIEAAVLKDGKYDLGGLKVSVKDGKATLSNGSLAGSTLLFGQAVKNFKRFTNCSLKELSRVSSYNTAINLKIKNIGRIEEGYKANLVLLDKELNVSKTYLSGEIVYER